LHKISSSSRSLWDGGWVTKTVLLESVSSLEQITMLDRECRDAITEATCVLWAPQHMPCLVLALCKWDGDEGAALAA